MRHKWKTVKVKGVKGEFERKKCENCGLQQRKIRRGSDEPHRGWTEVEFRDGVGAPWLSTRWRWDSGLPECNACVECPTCQGKGVVSQQKGE